MDSEFEKWFELNKKYLYSGDHLQNAYAAYCAGRKSMLQPCGHPLSAVVGDVTKYCSVCADDSLRKNINEGMEA